MPFRILGSTFRAGVLTGALVMAALPSAPTPLLAQQAAVPPDFTRIVRQKMPAVVAITTQEREHAQSMPEAPPGNFFAAPLMKGVIQASPNAGPGRPSGRGS
jgi:serine protease Do